MQKFSDYVGISLFYENHTLVLDFKCYCASFAIKDAITHAMDEYIDVATKDGKLTGRT